MAKMGAPRKVVSLGYSKAGPSRSARHCRLDRQPGNSQAVTHWCMQGLPQEIPCWVLAAQIMETIEDLPQEIPSWGMATDKDSLL